MTQLAQEKSATYRQEIKIPQLPTDTNDLHNFSSFSMHKAEIANDELIFENSQAFYEALQTGFFLLKIPEKLELKPLDKIVNQFYRDKNGSQDDAYKGFRDTQVVEEYQGYFDRPNDQWENLYLESANWAKFLPQDAQEAGEFLAETGITVLKNILAKLHIPQTEWEKITGGLTANKGHQMLAFNHFRPEKNMRGTKMHRDSGWVTVLRSTQPGLVALIEGRIYAINPEEGYFIINFGSSFELLTECLNTPVRANIHGVVKTLKTPEQHNRTSYVIFLDSDLSGHIYRFDQGKSIPMQTMKEFAIQEVSRTYDDSNFL